MSNHEWKYQKWQGEFEDAIIAIDREKLAEKIQTFEAAVFARLQELTSSSDHDAERTAITEAAFTIRLLKG